MFPNTSSGTANTDVYGYDTAGRMTSATWWDGTTSGTKLGSETYTRDTSTKGMVKTTTPTGSAGTTARTNTYDTRDRLSTAGTESFGSFIDRIPPVYLIVFFAILSAAVLVLIILVLLLRRRARECDNAHCHGHG